MGGAKVNMKTQNLYLVTVRGLNRSPLKSSYVVAEDPEAAYQTVRKHLDKEDYGFIEDRILESVKLLAETCDHGIPEIPALFLPEERYEAAD